MSALPPKADISRTSFHVHFVPTADVTTKKDRDPVWVISAIEIIPSPDKSLLWLLAIDARARSSFPRRKGAFAEETPPGCVRRTPVIWRGVVS